MKNAIVILGLLLLSLAYEKTYITLPNQNYVPKNLYYNPPYRVSPCYDPYRNLRYNPYLEKRNKRLYYNFMRLQRLRNCLTWDGLRSAKGSLTGYSVTIDNDIYKQMGITPYDPKQVKSGTHSTVKTQELYSMPQGDETYYRNGRIDRDLGGITGKTGVTIIYD